MEKRIPTYLLNKFLNGECTIEEEAAVKHWYASFENDNEYIFFTSEEQKQELKDRIYRIIIENISLQKPDTLKPFQDTHRTNKPRNILYIVSGIAALFLIAVSLFLFNYTPAKVNARELIIVTNNSKTIQERVLSDGSHVWLNPGAQIKFDKVFTGNVRNVTMTGESFFEVTKNPLKPFVVNTGNIIVKVWGTSFRIRDSKKINFADVAVVTGKVSVKTIKPNYSNQHKSKVNTTKEVMIYPNEQVTFLKRNNVLKTAHQANIKELFIWKKPSLSFDNKPLKQVMRILNKEFSVNIFSDDTKVNNDLC